MSGTKYTPGPWVAENRDWRGEPSPHRVYISGDHRVSFEDNDQGGADTCNVATGVAVVEGNATSREVTAANASLITEAPNLLESLSDLVAIAEMCPDFEPGRPDCDAYAVLEVAKMTIRRALGMPDTQG